MQMLPWAQKVIPRAQEAPAIAVPAGTHSSVVPVISQFSPMAQSMAAVAGLHPALPQIPKPRLVPSENPSSPEQLSSGSVQDIGLVWSQGISHF